MRHLCTAPCDGGRAAACMLVECRLCPWHLRWTPNLLTTRPMCPPSCCVAVKGLCLLTSKPMVYAANVAEDDLASPEENKYVQVSGISSPPSCAVLGSLAQQRSALPPACCRERGSRAVQAPACVLRGWICGCGCWAVRLKQKLLVEQPHVPQPCTSGWPTSLFAPCPCLPCSNCRQRRPRRAAAWWWCLRRCGVLNYCHMALPAGQPTPVVLLRCLQTAEQPGA